MVHTLRFFSSSKCSLFHNSNVFRSSIIHIMYTECAKIKKNNPGAERLNILLLVSTGRVSETCYSPDFSRQSAKFRKQYLNTFAEKEIRYKGRDLVGAEKRTTFTLWQTTAVSEALCFAERVRRWTQSKNLYTKCNIPTEPFRID